MLVSLVQGCIDDGFGSWVKQKEVAFTGCRFQQKRKMADMELVRFFNSEVRASII